MVIDILVETDPDVWKEHGKLKRKLYDSVSFMKEFKQKVPV